MKKNDKKQIAYNRKAKFDYIVEETIQAGIELLGCEVKSLRLNKVSFSDSYAHIENGQCFLSNLHISTYDKTRTDIPDQTRDRRLLLSKKEISKLNTLINRNRMTLIPIEIYFLGPWAKVLLGVCKGKTYGDKRNDLKEKAIKRDSERD